MAYFALSFARAASELHGIPDDTRHSVGDASASPGAARYSVRIITYGTGPFGF